MAALATVDHFGFGYPLPHEQEFDVLGKYILIYASAQLLAMAVAPKTDKLSGGNLLLWLVVNPIIVYWVRIACSLSTLICTCQTCNKHGMKIKFQ